MSHTDREEEPEALPEIWSTLRLLYSGEAGLRSDRTVVVQPPRVLLGRTVSGDTNIGLPMDRRASELHAEVVVKRTMRTQKAELVLRDLDSSNGTFVNGQRVKEAHLQDGDVVRMGSSFVLVREQPARVLDSGNELLLGSAPCIRRLRWQLAGAARRSDTVLLLGESGSGKDVAAQSLHRQSGRIGPFLAMNCAAIPSELAESQLFGHEKGAFSGAQRTHSGFFRAASGGTLFLDEIADMPLHLQPKLLRALEDGRVTPLGSTTSYGCDVRVVAATNGNLPAAVAAQRFRGELYARLQGIVIHVPPLRQRREDILPLLFAELSTTTRVRARLVEALLTYHFPYNVRELKQMATVLRRHLEQGEVLDLPHIVDRLQRDTPAPQNPQPPSTSAPPPTRELLIRLLKEHDGVVARVAAAVNRSHRHIRRLLQAHKIDSTTFAKPTGPVSKPN
jgi:DNA-binding NtrC family response regulator